MNCHCPACKYTSLYTFNYHNHPFQLLLFWSFEFLFLEMGNISSTNDKISTDDLYQVLQDSNLMSRNVLDMTPSPENFGELYLKTFPKHVNTDLPECMARQQDFKEKFEEIQLITEQHFLLFLENFGKLFPGRYVPVNVRTKIKG